MTSDTHWQSLALGGPSHGMRDFSRAASFVDDEIARRCGVNSDEWADTSGGNQRHGDSGRRCGAARFGWVARPISCRFTRLSTLPSRAFMQLPSGLNLGLRGDGDSRDQAPSCFLRRLRLRQLLPRLFGSGARRSISWVVT